MPPGKTTFKEVGEVANALAGLLDTHTRVQSFKWVDSSIPIRLGQVTGRLIAAGVDRLEQLADRDQLAPPCRSTSAHAEIVAEPTVDEADEAPEVNAAPNVADDEAPAATSDDAPAAPAAPVEVS